MEQLSAQYLANPEPRRPLFALVGIGDETLGVVVAGNDVTLLTREGLTEWLVRSFRDLPAEEVVRRMAPALRVEVVST